MFYDVKFLVIYPFFSTRSIAPEELELFSTVGTLSFFFLRTAGALSGALFGAVLSVVLVVVL